MIAFEMYVLSILVTYLHKLNRYFCLKYSKAKIENFFGLYFRKYGAHRSLPYPQFLRVIFFGTFWISTNRVLCPYLIYNKAICEHSPRLRAIQVYTRLHKTTQGYINLHKARQGYSYKQQTRQLSWFPKIAKPYERSHKSDNCIVIPLHLLY